MVLSISRGELERIKKGIINFQGGRVGGIILGPLFSTDMYKALQKILPTDIPIIFFNSIDEIECDHISIDLASGAEKVVDYLYSRNCRNIMYFNCPSSVIGQGGSGNTRYAGFLKGLHRYPIKFF
jgi:DNA-binding LacI/PurR family transcriptional regulator